MRFSAFDILTPVFNLLFCFSKSISKSYSATFAAPACPVKLHGEKRKKIDGALIIQKLLYSTYSQMVRIAFLNASLNDSP